MGSGSGHPRRAAWRDLVALMNSVASRHQSRLTGRMRRFLAVAVFSISALSAADVADMSGNWILNIQRSKWHGAPKPDSGRLVIEHQEPKLKYERTVTPATVEDKSMTFDGAIDGKEHNGIIATRLSPFSILFTMKSEDGTSLETTVTMTKDGDHLVRRIQSSGPSGKLTWTELYDKEQP